LRTIEERAVAYAAEAGELALGYLRVPPDVEYKDKAHTDPVTAADRGVELFLRQSIERDFPSHGVLGEEGSSEEAEGDFIWVLDPIDGTTNFIHHLPLFAISIGVLYRRRPVVGCVLLPTSYGPGPAIYHARLGGGAYLGERRLRVVEDDRPGPTRLAAVPGAFRHLYRQSREYRKTPSDSRVLGSISVEMTYVAAGSLHFGLYAGPKIWDIAAGLTLIREAGGTVLIHRPNAVRPLERFEPAPGLAPVEGLRRWRAPIVCGNPEIAGFVAANLRLSPPLRWRLRALWRRWRARREAGKPKPET
jgi:myo-inositol-1(or 4)-monophosphatase